MVFLKPLFDLQYEFKPFLNGELDQQLWHMIIQIYNNRKNYASIAKQSTAADLHYKLF